MVISNEGGVDIEGVAKENPEAIFSFPFDVDTGLTDKILDEVLSILKLSHNAVDAKE